MNRWLLGAGLLLLAAAPGCDRMLAPSARPVFGPWEEGLTLVYEDPRSHDRLQVRVKASRTEGPELDVTETYTTLTGDLEVRFRHRDGGVQLESGSQVGIRLLPEGFPDRVGHWEARDRFYRVVGRAAVDLPGVRLPDPAGAEGVWVESSRMDGVGARQRTLFVPDVGEAETREWQNGRWVVINRLVSRGFTDLPSITKGTSSGSNP